MFKSKHLSVPVARSCPGTRSLGSSASSSAPNAKPGPSPTLRGTWLRSGFDVSTQGFLSVGRADGERKAGDGTGRGTTIHRSMDVEKRRGLASLASDLANSFLGTI